jgi:predicted permease
MRLARHMLIESFVLSFAGGALAVLVAWWGASVLIAALTWKSLVLPIGPDARVFGFTLGLSLATALLFSLAPVYQALQTRVMGALKQQGGALTGHGSQMVIRKGLIALQMALSVLLLAGAGLFVRTLSSLRGVDTGLDTTRVLQMVDVHFHPYSPQLGPQAYHDYQRLIDRIESLPGVHSAAASWNPLLGDYSSNEFITVPGHQAFRVSINRVTSRFFETLGIPMLDGSVWSRQDDYLQVQDAVVSQSLARDLFGGASPIGRSLSTFTSGDYKIVGVVRDSNHYTNPREDDSRTAYLSPRGYWSPYLSICVRVAGDPARLVTAVRREAESIDPEVEIYHIRTLESQLDWLLWKERLVAWLSSSFGALAALLAAIGLYGVIAFSVAQRTPEIGLRMALGAGRRQIQLLVLRDVMVLIGAGAAMGIPAALALTRLAKSLLFGVAPNDPATLAGAGLLMGAVALLAGYLPVRRATKVDPMVALRCE